MANNLSSRKNNILNNSTSYVGLQRKHKKRDNKIIRARIKNKFKSEIKKYKEK